MTAALDYKAATHRVTPRDGFFEVVSGESGNTYRVVPTGHGEDAVCSCPARVARCSHVLSVIAFCRALQRPATAPATQPTAVKPAHPSAPVETVPPSTGERIPAGGPRDVSWIFDRVAREERAKEGR